MLKRESPALLELLVTGLLEQLAPDDFQGYGVGLPGSGKREWRCVTGNKPPPRRGEVEVPFALSQSVASQSPRAKETRGQISSSLSL